MAAVLLQLDPPIPLLTPRGPALAHVLIDYGVEHDLMWTTFQENGECWTWRNADVRAQQNITVGRLVEAKPQPNKLPPKPSKKPENWMT